MTLLGVCRAAAMAIGLSAMGIVGRPAAGPAAAQDTASAGRNSPPTGMAATDTGAVRDHLQLGVGYFDVFMDDDSALAASAIYRPGVRYLEMGAQPGDMWQGIGPQIGAGINTDGGALGHLGLFLDIRPFANVVVWPGANVAAWREGDSRDLGGTFQFMTELYVGYRLSWNDLVGVSLQHISNAHIHDQNPGTDKLLITYTLSFGPLFQD
jgi:hypothetical protein